MQQNLTVSTLPPQWMEQGLCVNQTSRDDDIWHSANIQDQQAAQEICQQCPVQQWCYQRATENNEQHGVWGGATFPRRNVVTHCKQNGHYMSKQNTEWDVRGNRRCRTCKSQKRNQKRAEQRNLKRRQQ